MLIELALGGLQQGLIKMQGGSRRSDGPGCARKYRLVARGVFLRVGMGDVGRQRHMPVLLHQLVRFIAELEVEQGAVFIRPATEEDRFKPATGAASHVQLGAWQGLLAHFHVCHHFVVGQHTFNQQLQLAARSLLAKDPGLDDFGVIEDQQVAGVKQPGQFTKDPVHSLCL